MNRRIAVGLLFAALFARGEAVSPMEMAAVLEARMAAGDGVTLPDPASEIVRHAGTVDLSRGEWPASFLDRVGGTICVSVSPFTGNYEFFDETGVVFWTVVPALPTTENWVAPFRHAQGGASPDDDLYAPWRLVDVWSLSHAEFAESAETFVTRHSSLVTRGATSPATNLCFTALAFSETNLVFTAAWPTTEPLPDATLDLYGSTNLLDPRWMFLSSHLATNPPVEFAVAHASLPWHVEPTQHVHDVSCESITNIVVSPLDGTSVYTNVFWSCATNRTPGEAGFFRLGTRLDTDGDGLFDAWEKLVTVTDPTNPDTDGDGVPDGRTTEQWLDNPLWANNGDCTNLVIFLYEPITNGVAALRFDEFGFVQPVGHPNKTVDWSRDTSRRLDPGSVSLSIAGNPVDRMEQCRRVVVQSNQHGRSCQRNRTAAHSCSRRPTRGIFWKNPVGFHELGYVDGEISFVDTGGPRPRFGEAHCASNAKRRRDP